MKPERKKQLCVERKKGETQINNLHTTLHKHKTACDAHGFVRSFFSKAYILDIYQTER